MGISDQDIIALNQAVDDSNLQQKADLANLVQFQQNGSPLFSIFEISESGVCNRSCSFCPRSAPGFPEEKKFITSELIDSIALQLASVDFSGIVLFSGFVEPLLDKKIPSHIERLRGALPNAELHIVTNGDPLTTKMLNALFQAGLSKLLISMYDGPEQADELFSLIERSLFPVDKVVFRRRWPDELGVLPISLSNRGGLMVDASDPIDSLSRPMANPCYYPSHTFFVDYLGDVLLCAHDWGKKFICGNIFKDSIIDIWNGPRFDWARNSLIDGKRNFSPCDVCNVKGDRMGAKHASVFRGLR